MIAAVHVGRHALAPAEELLALVTIVQRQLIIQLLLNLRRALVHQGNGALVNLINLNIINSRRRFHGLAR